ncbi:hypothetical protein [Roseicyclus mahoneyensis]|nr:hypothetical protein [Roseicyclus mahoneyensis]
MLLPPLFIRLDPFEIAVLIGLGLGYLGLLLGLFGLGLWLLRRRPVIGVALMVAVLGWCFGPTLAANLRGAGFAALVETWQIEPDDLPVSQGRVLVLEFDGVEASYGDFNRCWNVCSALLHDADLAEVHVLILPPDAMAQGSMSIAFAALAREGRLYRITLDAPEIGMDGYRPMVVASVEMLPAVDLVILEDRYGSLVTRAWSALMPDLPRPGAIGTEPGTGALTIIDSLHVWSQWPEPGQDARPLARRLRAMHEVPQPILWPAGVADPRYYPDFGRSPYLADWLCDVGVGATCPPP